VAEGLLPSKVVNRPKVAFFHGSGERAVYRSFARMLADDGGALLEEAVAAPGAADFLNATRLREFLGSCLDDPRSESVETLLRAINIGLLAGMVAELPPPVVTTHSGPLLRATSYPDLDSAKKLGLTSDISPTTVVRLKHGVVLSQGEKTWYLAVDGVIEYEPEDEWLTVLRAVDGIRTVAEIAGATDDLHSIVSQLVDLDVLETR
jgi:asparagine synthase (glutamine-hydrolysing)